MVWHPIHVSEIISLNFEDMRFDEREQVNNVVMEKDLYFSLTESSLGHCYDFRESLKIYFLSRINRTTL